MRRWVLAALTGFLFSGCSIPTALPSTMSVDSSLTAQSVTPSVQPKAPAPTPTLRRPSAQVTSSQSATPESGLTEKNPEIQKLDSYLQSTLANFNGLDLSFALAPEDVSGDGRPDLVARDPYDKAISLGLIFQDANGDSQDDLTILGNNGLIVLIWGDNSYRAPFYLPSEWGTSAAKYGSSISVEFKDWTDDNIPEIVYEETSSSGGTGFETSVTTRSLIHCAADLCQLVWQEVIANSANDNNLGGMLQNKADIRLVTSAIGQPAIRLMSSAFRIYCCSDMASSPYPFSGLYVYTSTVSTYTWNGTSFEFTDSAVFSRDSFLSAQSVLSAQSASGVQASISWNESEYLNNDYCQLFINGQAAGTPFACRRNFTTVSWEDITGDGQSDIVVLAYSGSYPTGPAGQLGNEACAHQRLLAYQWDNSQAVEIANVAGCVIQKDLYGVKLQDYDSDGLVEILAAPLAVSGAGPNLENRAYKWNGSKFVLWSNIPLPP